MTRRNWLKELRTAASTFDWATVNELSSEYAAYLYAVPALPAGVGQILQR